MTTMIALVFFGVAKHFQKMSQKNVTYQLKKPDKPTCDQELSLMNKLKELFKEALEKK